MWDRLKKRILVSAGGHNRFTVPMLLVVVASFAVMGVLSFNILRGAGFGVAVHPEEFIDARGDYEVINDESVLGGSYVRFGASQAPAEVSEPVFTDPPSLDRFPTVSSAGPKTGTLSTSGSQTLEREGVVLENLEIEGRVTITASNTTVRNVRIRTRSFNGITIGEFASNTTIENVEIVGTGSCNYAISGYNFNLRGSLIQGCQNGIELAGGQSVIDGNVIRGQTDERASAVRIIGGGTHTISGLRCEQVAVGSRCVYINPVRSSIGGVTVSDSLLSAGSNAIEIEITTGFEASDIVARHNVVQSEPRLNFSNQSNLISKEDNLYQDGQVIPN